MAAAIQDAYSDLFTAGWPAADKLPVVYSPAYNLSFWGLEKLHPFDSQKFRRVVALLEDGGVLSERQLVPATEASHEILREVHTERYLRKLDSSSFFVAQVGLVRWVALPVLPSAHHTELPARPPTHAPQVTELPPLLFLPSFLLRRKVLRPFATHAGGTMQAAALALQHGWAVNLGGGMHHAAPDAGGGWCAYADLWLALRRLRTASGGSICKVMVIDLDVHQVRGLPACLLAAAAAAAAVAAGACVIAACLPLAGPAHAPAAASAVAPRGLVPQPQGNGVGRCKLEFSEQEGADVFIIDLYGGRLYPWDTEAKQVRQPRMPEGALGFPSPMHANKKHKKK